MAEKRQSIGGRLSLDEIFEDTPIDKKPPEKRKRGVSEETLWSSAEDSSRGKATAENRGTGTRKDTGTNEDFTEFEVDALISEAWKGARGCMEEGSHSLEERLDSQSESSFHKGVRKILSNLQASLPAEPSLKHLAQGMWEVLKLCDDSCDAVPKSTAKRKDIFPLPASGSHVASGDSAAFLQCTMASLNGLYGVKTVGAKSQTPASVIKRLDAIMKQSGVLEEKIPGLSFQNFFAHKTLDYCGEEIKLARKIRWESIEASLPDEVGRLDVREFISDGVLHYVNNFSDFLIPEHEMNFGKPPSVMVEKDEWPFIAEGLVKRGLCDVVPESKLFHANGSTLFSGMFAISKDEFKGNIEICRLIMNYKPLNSICLALEGDTPSLPSITNMGSFHLADGEVLATSSEDIRCFFYLFRLPEAWRPYLGFGLEVPEKMRVEGHRNERCFLSSNVLPMGFVNSVGIAQHIHRNVVKKAMGSLQPPLSSGAELRRDRAFSSAPHLYRIYLDNFDELLKTDARTAELIQGTPSDVAQALRKVYEEMGLPRHPKKSVEQALQAEVQGAWIDGVAGTISAKPSKIAKYVALGLEVLREGKASQRELQVIGGGFVYIAMFKRPLLCGLNQIWKTIVDMGEGRSRRIVPKQVMSEIARFIGLIPLSFINLRCDFDPMTTVSDASTTGGGFCASRGLSPFGLAASTATVRGEVPDEEELCTILSIGLFDGIAALRVALDCLGLPVVGHISIEKDQEARRVVEAYFPETVQVDDVEKVDEAMVKLWALKYSTVSVVVVGSGPPCQGVSGLNTDRRGALKDHRSVLFKHIPRVVGLVRRLFPWAQVHSLTESVASMDAKDCNAMNDEFGDSPWFIDSFGIALCHRPRLYWVSWELLDGEGAWIGDGSDGRLPICGEVALQASLDAKDYLEPGWHVFDDRGLPTFTTSRPSPVPLRRPAGLKDCDKQERGVWAADSHRFPPYQYKRCNCLHNSTGEWRPPNILEREVIMGFPAHYTKQCMKKAVHDNTQHRDKRLSLIGNTWCVPVVAWLLSCLFHVLGFLERLSVQDIVSRLAPGKGSSLQSILLRPPLQHSTSTFESRASLTQRLSTLVSLKGEDLLLQSQTETPVRYHRLRSSIPSKLWRWKTICGWQWTGSQEHINVLELRAALTSIRWRVEQQKQLDLRCIHLVDSLVCLHALTRGRSSSRKMRRTLMRLNSYLLVTGLQPLWGYVSTHDNPADRPSRRGVKKKWLKKQVR